MSKNLLVEQKANSALYKTTSILAKIAEILHWCLAGVMFIGGFITLIHPSTILNLIKTTITNSTVLSCYGFEVAVTNSDGTLRTGMLILFTFGSTIVLTLMAMIFRNVYLILKTAKGKTWFAKGNTPFQNNIVRMFREIGIFFIAISVLSLISEIILNITGSEINTGFNYLSCFMGLVFLCISQFFNYGTRLEQDLDGLV